MAIANLALSLRGKLNARRRLARWISGAVGLTAGMLVWASWGWLIFGRWALAAAGLRPWPHFNTWYACVMILFGLVTVVALAAILKRAVARKPSSPA